MGRQLGFPTINIDVENELMPAHGVYVTAVHIPSFSRVFPSVTNIGVRPTVYENYQVTVESHVLDFTADVYREPVRLFFLRRLRDEMVFGSSMELVAQIRRDVETAEALLRAARAAARRSWCGDDPAPLLVALAARLPLLAAAYLVRSGSTATAGARSCWLWARRLELSRCRRLLATRAGRSPVAGSGARGGNSGGLG